MVALGAALALLLALLALLAYAALAARRMEAQVPPQGRFIEVEGTRLHYVDRGQGPVIVLVHGLSGQLGNFTYGLLDHLAERHRVIALDRPGSGYSTTGNGQQPDLAAQARIVAAFIRQLELERPMLVGHSLGGALSLVLVQDHPQSIGALALIAPLAFDDVRATPLVRMVLRSSIGVRRALVWTFAVPLGQLGSAANLKAIFAPEPAPVDFGVRGGGLLALRPENVVAASVDIVTAIRELAVRSAHYPALAMPVAILFGRGDRVLSPRRHGERLAQAIPGASLTLIDGGHMLPVTRPEAVAEWLAGWVASPKPVAR
jgi:pimeloyl-ACP methyl ester carboxylesterase